MENYHLIAVKYFGATNTKGSGSRIKLTSTRFEQSIFIPFNHSLNNPEDMAIEYLKKQGHKIQGKAEFVVICKADKNHQFKSLKD